jgi:hypothetical protein
MVLRSPEAKGGGSMSPTEKLPPKIEWQVTSVARISRHGHHVTAFMFLHSWLRSVLEAYLGPKCEGRGFRELVDLVQADGNRFEGKGEMMEQLRDLDERVTTALNEPGPNSWEKANRALEPHAESSFELVRRLLPLLFDFSSYDEMERVAQGGRDGIEKMPPG